jgi:hypothetical protein
MGVAFPLLMQTQRNAPTPRLDALQANLEDAFVMINFAFERALNGWAGTADNLPERSCQTLSLAIKSAQVSVLSALPHPIRG